MQSVAGRFGRMLPLALLAGVPALFLLLVFFAPNVFLATLSIYKSESQAITNTVTLDNFSMLLSRRLYYNAILRSFYIGAGVATIVVICAYPIAYFLSRTRSRWKNALTALVVAPLLASVVVRTYGWWVLLNPEGLVNKTLAWLGLVQQPLQLLPSNEAIIMGLAHSMMPYGVLTLFASINNINPRLEQAALSLGATRLKTFVFVTLPLSSAGIAGAFILSFSLAIGAYATPAMLGGPSTETMATLLYKLMTVALDWSLGAALAVILLASVLLLAGVSFLLGRKVLSK